VKQIKQRAQQAHASKKKHARRPLLIARGLAYMKVHDMALEYTEV
jgi:hypothetical protein